MAQCSSVVKWGHSNIDITLVDPRIFFFKTLNEEFTDLKKIGRKAEKILKGSLDLIPSPSRSGEHLNFLFFIFSAIKCWAFSTNLFRQNICWQHPAMFCQKKYNKKFKCSPLLEGDGIKSRLPFKIFSTLSSSYNFTRY